MADQDRVAAAQEGARAVDEFLRTVEEPKRAELERIRTLAKQIVPDAQETIKYGMPTLMHQGKPFLGFLAHKRHIGLYPYSGEVIETLKDHLREYELSKGAIRVPLDHPIPESALRLIIEARLAQIRRTAAGG